MINENWKDIHEDFNEYCQNLWKDYSFNYQTTKEWKKVLGENFKPKSDWVFCVWLRDEKHLTAQEVEKQRNLEGLKKEYNKLWTDINPDFAVVDVIRTRWNGEVLETKTRQQQWEEANITFFEAQKWIQAGFKPNDHWEVKEWRNYNFAPQEARSWREIDLEKWEYKDAEFVAYLRWKKYQPSSDLNIEQLKKESKIAQNYLDWKYPWSQRSTVEELNIWTDDPFGEYRSLKGELDLSDFINLKKLNCSGNNLTSLNISNCFQLEEIDCSKNPLTSLDIGNNDKITSLNCYETKLTNLDLGNLSNLVSFECGYSLLTNLILPTNPANLKTLSLHNNNFPAQDLAFLTKAVNLEVLNLGNDCGAQNISQSIYNRFTGSLDYLSNMKKLRELNISDTDINEFSPNKLPNVSGEIRYSTNYRSDCKLNEIIPQLNKYKYGFCQKCQQINTNYNWCQSCQEKELEQLTGQELVESFIQQVKQQKNLELKWIPYEKFANIEYLADGGFSKIYKANWKKGEYSNDKAIVLKSLNDSQNITLDFLTEFANAKVVKGSSYIVDCLGLSQDPITKNYIIVMEYMKEGNLRQCLQNRVGTGKSDLKGKLTNLWQIVYGIKSIHDQGLVHRDLHAGNVLHNDVWVYVTDLGLSQPANYRKKEGKVFGVFPYVAPEVLQGKPYAPESDIYSFGIVAYEVLANSYPYYDQKNLSNEELSKEIYKGLRPNIDEIKIPQGLKVLIKKCWDANPQQRPTAKELDKIFQGQTEFAHEVEEMKEEYNNFSQNIPYKIHPTATITRELIDTKQITKLLKKLEINLPLDDELKELIREFVRTNKKTIKDKKDEQAMEKFGELWEKLEQKGLSEESIKKVIDYCEKLVDLEEWQQDFIQENQVQQVIQSASLLVEQNKGAKAEAKAEQVKDNSIIEVESQQQTEVFQKSNESIETQEQICLQQAQNQAQDVSKVSTVVAAQIQQQQQQQNDNWWQKICCYPGKRKDK